MKRILLIITLILFSTPALSANISVLKSSETNVVIGFQDSIAPGDFVKFKNLVDNIKNKSIVLVMASPGGVLEESILIGEYVKHKKIKTIAGGLCASGCAYIWLAGDKKGVAPEANLGFHSAYATDGQRSQVTGQGNALLGAYLTKLGYGYELIAYVTEAELQQMQWMTADVARKLKIEFYTIKNKDDFNAFVGV